MRANWTKIRNDYVNSTMSQADIAKKYSKKYENVTINSVKLHCASENWVELRKKQQELTTEKLLQKTAEKISDKEAEQVSKVKDITSTLLDAIVQAAKEISITELRQKKQVKKIEDKGQGVREEQTVTKEYLERTESAIDVGRVQNITTALKNILEIDALLGGKGIDESKAFDDLMALIGGTNASD